MSLEHEMNRIPRDVMLMEIAEIIAQRGTCSRLQVGCVISREGRIIVTGYNGAPAGLPHCDHSFDERPIRYILPDIDNSEAWAIESGRVMEIPQGAQMSIVDNGCQTAEHSERNAIAFAARHGLALDGGDLHVTHAPCLNCARVVVNTGIRRVFYLHPYRKTEGVELLRKAGIRVFDMSTNEG